MSSGARVVSYIKEEVTPGVTPAGGSWDVLRLTNNILTPTPNTEVSDEITDQRLSQGSVVTSVDIGGNLEGEFSFATFDKLLAAAFYNEWNNDVLVIGALRKTFSIVKGYADVGVYATFLGMHVSTFALDIPSEGKVTVTFGMAGLDYVDGEVSPVGASNPPTTTAFLSNQSVGTLLVNGESLEGQACVSAITMNLDNSLQVQRCLGTGKVGPGAQIATEAAFTGTITLAWSKRAWELWKNSFTRQTIGVTFPLRDAAGNEYVFSLPSIEIDGELPSGGKRDLIEATLNYTVSKVSPTITRVPAAVGP